MGQVVTPWGAPCPPPLSRRMQSNVRSGVCEHAPTGWLCITQPLSSPAPLAPCLQAGTKASMACVWVSGAQLYAPPHLHAAGLAKLVHWP